MAIDLYYINRSLLDLVKYLFESPIELSKELKIEFLPPLRPKRIRNSAFTIIHAHTSFSDGDSNLVELVEACMHNDVQIIGITDHENDLAFSYLQRYRELYLPHGCNLEYAGKRVALISYGKNILYILRGKEELTKEGKDLLILGYEGTVSSRRPAKDMIQETDDKGGFVIVPHPFMYNYGVGPKLLEDCLAAGAIALEISSFQIFPACWGNMLTRRYNSPKVIGMDLHQRNWLKYKSGIQIPDFGFINEDEAINKIIQSIQKETFIPYERYVPVRVIINWRYFSSMPNKSR